MRLDQKPDWVRPGAKCVCIDGEPRSIRLYPDGPLMKIGGVYPVKGNIYTIAAVEVYTSQFSAIGTFLGVHLREIKRPAGALTGRVVPYRVERFRPVIEVTQEQDAKLFAPLLNRRHHEDA